MAGRRTNLALLALLLLAFVTGVASWIVGPRLVRWIVIAHGIVGLGIVALAPWKSTIARRGLQRRRPGRGIAITFAVLIVASIVAALVHVTGVVGSVGTLSPLGIHVATAVGAIAVAVMHVVQRPVRPRTTDLSRRSLLRGGAVLGAGAAGWLALEGVLRVTGARGDSRRVTGSFETGSGVPADMPVTQWLNDQVQEVDAASWRLRMSDGARSYSMNWPRSATPYVRRSTAPAGGTRNRYGEAFGLTGCSKARVAGPSSSDRSPATVGGSLAQALPGSSWRPTSETLRCRPATGLPHVWSRRAAVGSGG
jgi:hypothetical protein